MAAIIKRRGADYLEQRRMTLETPKHGPREVDLSLSPGLAAVLRAQVASLEQRHQDDVAVRHHRRWASV